MYQVTLNAHRHPGKGHITVAVRHGCEMDIRAENIAQRARQSFKGGLMVATVRR